MYNQILKSQFLRERYGDCLRQKQEAERLFEKTQPYEEAAQADLCAMTVDQLQKTIDETFFMKRHSHIGQRSAVGEYMEWCLAHKVEGATDNYQRLEAVGLNKIRYRMVSGPLQMQVFLDSVFDAEAEETTDVIYRCYYWLAFCGVDEFDVPNIKVSDVDLQKRVIRYRDMNLEIYREAMPAFEKAVTLSEMRYKNARYTEPIWRKRVDGDTLMRGVRAASDVFTVRKYIGQRLSAAQAAGEASQRINYSGAKLSGMFYRVYERERAGVPVGFSELAVTEVLKKNPSADFRTRSARQSVNAKEREYLDDYRRWKLAFTV